MKLRQKIVYAFVILMIFVFIGLGFLIGQLFKSYYVSSFQEQFKKEGSLIVEVIERDGVLDLLDSEWLNQAHQTLQARITITDKDGQVLYDDGDENTLHFSKHQETITRVISESSGKEKGIFQVNSRFDIIYYWKKINFNNENEGILVLSTTLKELNSAYRQIWILLFISLSLAFIVTLYIGSRIMTRYTKPIESATNTAIELAKGNYRARTYEDDFFEFGKLSSSINILARNLQKITKEQEIQTDRLMTLIENMGTGLLLVDDKGYVTLTNRTYKEIFMVENKDLLGLSYTDVIHHKEVADIINQVFMTEQRARKQVVLPIGIHLKSFEVYGAPIISVQNEWKGIIIVFHDITELKRLEQIRKDFVANVSHELKTPVTSIKGFAETLLDGASKDEQTLESFLNIILKESERLQSIIADLLELSRIEQHGFSIKQEKVNITEIIENIVEVLVTKANKKNITIQLNHTKPYIIQGEALRIKQIFINIISNAIAYTPSNGKIDISFIEDHEYISVSITDTGIGIANEELPRIFERFYRVDKDRSRNSGGTGLGLAIVKHLVEAHHGEISVESEPGKGTSFIINFPKFTNRNF